MTPSIIYLANTNSYQWDGSQFAETTLDNQLIANLFAYYKNLFFPGFEVGAGINNLLNTNVYTQPYVKQGDYRGRPLSWSVPRIRP